MKITSEHLVILFGCLLAVSTFADAQVQPINQPGLQIQFDDNGLSSLRFQGAEMLQSSTIELPKLDLRHGFPPGPATVKPADPQANFDIAAHRLTQSYPWGTLICTYRKDSDRLMLDLEVHNTSKDSIFGITAAPLKLKLPGSVKIHSWVDGWPTPSVTNDAPGVLDVSSDAGQMAICNEQVDRPVWLGLQKVNQTDLYQLVLRHDGPPRGQEINVGDWRQFFLSIRFAPKGTPPTQLAQDIYQKFAQRYPSSLKWDDRRPIGCNFVSSMDTTSATNPTGWLHDKTVDMTTTAGRADWKKRMLERFDKSASVGKELNCQGVIVWDIEGQRNPQPISYIGDPRLLPTLSPEMDAIADECFRKYTDAGLRCGVTIRPTHVVPTPGGPAAWEHINVEDIAAELCGKIEYAKKRWGCTLFYTDSTVRWDLNASGEFSLHTIPAEVFQTVHERYPDVLLIPEETSVRHFAYSAPYHEIMASQFYTHTPDEVRAIYPNAFSMIRISDAMLIEKDSEALIAAMRGGDIIMFRTWLDDPDNVPVKKILAEVYKK